MANPKKGEALVSDRNGRPMLATAQTLIADMATTAATTSTPYGFATAAQADSIATRINLILDCLEAHGLMKAS